MARIIFGMMGAVLLGLLAACDKGVQPPVMFGAAARLGAEPVYLARTLGHLPAERLQLVDFASADEVKQAFLNRKLQLAAVTLEDAVLLRKDVPDLKIILLFDAAGGLDAAKVPVKVLDVLITRDEYIGQYRKEILQLLQGWRLALEMVQREPAKARQAMAQHSQLSQAQFDLVMQNIQLLGLQQNQQLLLGEPAPIAPRLDELQRSMLRSGLLRVGVDASTLLDATILAAVKSDGEKK